MSWGEARLWPTVAGEGGVRATVTVGDWLDAKVIGHTVRWHIQSERGISATNSCGNETYGKVIGRTVRWHTESGRGMGDVRASLCGRESVRIGTGLWARHICGRRLQVIACLHSSFVADGYK